MRLTLRDPNKESKVDGPTMSPWCLIQLENLQIYQWDRFTEFRKCARRVLWDLYVDSECALLALQPSLLLINYEHKTYAHTSAYEFEFLRFYVDCYYYYSSNVTVISVEIVSLTWSKVGPPSCGAGPHAPTCLPMASLGCIVSFI